MIIDLEENRCLVTFHELNRSFTKSIDTQKFINALSSEESKSFNLLPHNTRYISHWQGHVYVAVERARHKRDIVLDGKTLKTITFPAMIFFFVLSPDQSGFGVINSYVFAINDDRVIYDYTDFLIPSLPGVNANGKITWKDRRPKEARTFISELVDLDSLVSDFLNSDIESEKIKTPKGKSVTELFTKFEEEEIHFDWLQTPEFNQEILTLVKNVFDPKHHKATKLAFVKKVS